MGAKAKRRQEFLQNHPVCCFCGGLRRSEEIDHVPSRVLFRDRQWPEGFEFPACVKCNRASRLDEQVVALLALIYPDATNPDHANEIQERLRAVSHNHPAVLREMEPTVAQLRSAARRYGIRPLPGQTHRELPLLAVNGPLVNAAIENFSRKVGCALFYKHTDTILPSDAAILVRWYTNLQIEEDEIPRELADLLVGFPTVQRARTNLADQFFYRWAVSDTHAMAGFLAFFRQAFAILIFVDASRATAEIPTNARVLRPYTWA